MKTLSVGILDDLQFILKITCEITDLKEDVKRICNSLRGQDRSQFFDDKFFTSFDKNVDCIVKSLKAKRFFVRNRYNKYYVIAFAIDYTRFEIFSKDYSKKLISWRDNEDDPISEEGIIIDENYNENPVETLMKALYGGSKLIC